MWMPFSGVATPIFETHSFRTTYPCHVIEPYIAPSIFDRPEVAQRLQHRRENRRREFCHRYHTKLQWGLS